MDGPHDSPRRVARFARSLFVVALALSASLSLQACESSDTGTDNSTTEETTEIAGGPEQTETPIDLPPTDIEEMPTPPPAPPPQTRGRSTMPDRGDFIPRYEPTTKPQFAEYERALEGSRLLERIAKDLNENLILPYDVSLSLRECGIVNAMYEPSQKRISMCYEFVDFVGRLYLEQGGPPEQVVRGINGALYFTFYHEIGHALVDVLDLPVTGQQEEVADELSVFVLIHAGEEGEDLVLNGARFWALMAAKRQQMGVGQQYWDEHLTNEQRFYNIVCFLYGSNPSKYSNLVPDPLPPPRAQKCPDAYVRFVKGWVNVLKPFVKQ